MTESERKGTGALTDAYKRIRKQTEKFLPVVQDAIRSNMTESERKTPKLDFKQRQRAQAVYEECCESPEDMAFKYVALESDLATATQRAEALEAALRTASVALDDWLHDFAPEFCDPLRVAQAHARIHEYGTVGYIAHVQQIVRAALADEAGK